MRKQLAAFALSLVLAVGGAPALAFGETPGHLSAAGVTGAAGALTQQGAEIPEITVVRAASGKLAMKSGDSYKLGAEATAGTLSYKSSNTEVATVSSKGVVKAKEAGKATIAVIAKDGAKKASKKVSLAVLPAKKYTAVKKVEAEATVAKLAKGETAKVKVTFSPSEPSNGNVVFESSNPKVLAVNAAGKIKALKAGEAKVTVTSCDNAKAKDSVAIKVKAGASKSDDTVVASPLLDRSKWKARMNLPTDKQVNRYKASTRSPYIVCWPQFDGKSGYMEYAVDFKADSQPRGTYVNIGNWWMDVSSLKKKYAAVTTDDGDDPGSAYAGFQVLEDGRKVAIMSVWKTLLRDKGGKETVLNAKRTYPKNPSVADDFGGEGTGVKTLVDYDWQAGKTYRALIQCGTTSKGNCEIVFSVCDLETDTWTKLIAYDLGYGNTCIKTLGCFLENYLPESAAAVRTVEWSNFRARSHDDGTWISAKSAKMERQFTSWQGSYNYGSDASCFWAITSGVPGLCDKPPANGKAFSVSKAAKGAPA